MPPLTIEEIGAGLEALHAGREAAVHATAAENQRLAALAGAEQARRHREAALTELATLEANEADLRAGLADREKQMATLYSEILVLRTQFNSLLAELERKRRSLGL